MSKLLVPALLSTLLLASGCATVAGPRPGSELVGRGVQLVPERGQPSTLFFNRGGVVTSTFGERRASGRWWVRDRRLCFLWAGDFRECWPYPAPLAPGETVAITSDRGNRLRVTLLQ